jgi:D-beta-D-heptose 7-phosphate kinase/D-beta-D-heptose 1-phosphate adenosyltransferase
MANYNQHIILLGDIIVDHTIQGTSTRFANETQHPVPIIQSTTEKYDLGGGSNVLANLSALSCKVFMFGRMGTDRSEQINQMMPNCENHIIVDPHYITTTKHRIYNGSKLICRYDNEQYKETSTAECNEILLQISKIIKTYPITSVVFSDYNNGFLTEELCRRVIDLSNKYGICTVIDPRHNYKKYVGCTIIKPNRLELKNIFNIDLDKVSLLHAHKELHDMIGCKTSIITLANKGISAYTDNKIYSYCEDVANVIDVLGAGDIVCSVISAYHSLDIQTLLYYTSYFASISVKYVGVYIITQKDMEQLFLYKEIPSLSKNKIVFTNGCFDILHSAHIELFAFCRSLGSTVIVGLNSDASIKRLKGLTRPVNCFEDRVKMLKAISYIDFIIPFEEDTPEQLIKSIRPDYLIKGGDYKKDEVIGREYAKEVVIFDYIEGKSTTNIIKTINNNLK